MGIWEGVFLLALSSEDTLRNLYLSIAEITCSISGDSDFLLCVGLALVQTLLSSSVLPGGIIFLRADSLQVPGSVRHELGLNPVL